MRLVTRIAMWAWPILVWWLALPNRDGSGVKLRLQSTYDQARKDPSQHDTRCGLQTDPRGAEAQAGVVLPPPADSMGRRRPAGVQDLRKRVICL